MKFTFSWLKDYLDTTATLDDITDALNKIGLEVEGVENMAEKLAGFSVAKVRKASKHPDADRLQVCEVETADGIIQVVCGAPNARTGMTGIFAPVGTHIPGTGVDLQKGVIRGVESAGMLCSERELMLSDDHEGIIDLDDNLTIGTPAAEALGMDDPVIDIAITPNRPDALGVYGIARDLAACGLGTLKPLKIEPVEGTYDSPVSVSLDFKDGDTTPAPCFIGRHFRGVKNGPSPKWMQNRLRAIGLRPISALVDITNYVTFAFSRPLHVFDVAKINGNIHARLARKGESLAALDGKTYELDETMTVIADDERPEGLAGVIGGEASGCDENTTEVFLEVAYFDPVRTAMTGRKLNIMTDARYRFERGIDPQFMHPGAEIATRLILDICGGEASRKVIAGSPPDHTRSYLLRNTRVKTLGGLDISLDRQREILMALGFSLTARDQGLDCAVPSWRPDVHGEADLVEEVCRIHGLDNIPAVPLDRSHAVTKPVLNNMQKRMLLTRRTLASRGMHEAVTWSFLKKEYAQAFGGGSKQLELANPMSSDLTDMRPSLIPNLVSAAGRNAARGFANVSLFEVAQAYAGLEPEDETLRAAGVRRGDTGPRHWSEKPRAFNAYDVKADALAALEAAGAPVQSLQVVKGAPQWFHPGRSGTFQLGPKNQLGWFGELHPRILAMMDVSGPLVAFEIVFDNIPAARSARIARPALEISDLMPVTRDFAFVVDTKVEAEQMIRAARGADKKLISNVSVFDVFEDSSLGKDKKSIALEITLQPREKSLTDAEIETVSSKVIEKVTKATGAILRGQG